MLLYEKGSLGYFLELAKKDGFNNLFDWNVWRKENRKMKSLQDIETERVQKMGFKNIKDYRENLFIKKDSKAKKIMTTIWQETKVLKIRKNVIEFGIMRKDLFLCLIT